MIWLLIKTFFNQVKAIVDANQNNIQTMNDSAQKAANTAKITNLYISGLAATNQSVDNQIISRLSTELWVMLVQITLDQTRYMNTQSDKYVLAMNGDMAQVYTHLDEIQAATTDDTILTNIGEIRSTLDQYNQAALDWRTNVNKLSTLEKKWLLRAKKCSRMSSLPKMPVGRLLLKARPKARRSSPRGWFPTSLP